MRGAEGGQARQLLEVPLEEALLVEALDAALTALSRVDPRKCRVVELRFFGGLRVAETAEVLDISEETVKRDWIEQPSSCSQQS